MASFSFITGGADSTIISDQVNKRLFDLLFLHLLCHHVRQEERNCSDPNARTNSTFYSLEKFFFSVGQQMGLDEKALSSKYNVELNHDASGATSPTLQIASSSTPSPNTSFTLSLDPIDLMKYFCKEWWQTIFSKPIDSLKTNHKGTFLLTDQDFSWTKHLMDDAPTESEAQYLVILYLAVPCGLLRGALSVAGLIAAVTAEIPTFPCCNINIRLAGAMDDNEIAADKPPE